ncbi:MAG: hypothetical protein ACQEQP_00825 [Bacillota bacterium]
MIKGYLSQVKFAFNLISKVIEDQGISASNSLMRFLIRIRETLKPNSLSFNMAYPYRDLDFRKH